jgi:hypothetical protein
MDFLARAEPINLDFCTNIIQLHPDIWAFMCRLSQDDKTEGFDWFLSLVTI